MGLATLSSQGKLIREGRSLALIGRNGLGKTMVARNSARQAVLAQAALTR